MNMLTNVGQSSESQVVGVRSYRTEQEQLWNGVCMDLYLVRPYRENGGRFEAGYKEITRIERFKRFQTPA